MKIDDSSIYNHIRKEVENKQRGFIPCPECGGYALLVCKENTFKCGCGFQRKCTVSEVKKE